MFPIRNTLFVKKLYILTLLFALGANALFGQVDSLNMWQGAGDSIKLNPSADPDLYKYQTRLPRALYVPTALIGLGVAFIDNPVYDRFDAKRDVREAFPNFDSRLDDIMIFAPYIELAALNLVKIPCTNDWINTSLLIIKSEILANALVFGTKYLTHVERPDASDFLSFPSGHTAQAFVAASIVHKEYRERSPWYGIGAYGIAVTVGAFRMLNNKHWLSDVVAGAGIGLLSTHLVYATHQHRWGRKAVCLVPIASPRMKGVMFAYSF